MLGLGAGAELGSTRFAGVTAAMVTQDTLTRGKDLIYVWDK